MKKKSKNKSFYLVLMLLLLVGAGNTNLSWLIENTSEDSNSGATENLYGNNSTKYLTLSLKDSSLYLLLIIDEF